MNSWEGMRGAKTYYKFAWTKNHNMRALELFVLPQLV